MPTATSDLLSYCVMMPQDLSTLLHDNGLSVAVVAVDDKGIGRRPQKLPPRASSLEVAKTKPSNGVRNGTKLHGITNGTQFKVNGATNKATNGNGFITNGTSTKDDNQSDILSTDASDPQHKKLMRSKPFKDPNSPESRALKAMIILNRYRMKYQNDWDIPKAISNLRPFLQQAIRNKDPIRLVLPAFPFKSSNRTAKVLGPEPDDAERISLLYLEGLCKALEVATELEVELVITSDGVVYNGKSPLARYQDKDLHDIDLLGVSDTEVWHYGEGIRRIAKQQG
ncbi:hypothetical protein IL306_013393 [Fusarium sp. DS 682]|nr:hypothetical protein IL306_013393 [Fusarium sp. DS 682]